MADIKVRVGQQNAIKVVSSISGSIGDTVVNVIGGIASVSQLSVSGVSTFVGIATFQNDVYIGGDLYVQDDIVFDDFSANDATLSGNLSVAGITTLASNGGITTTGGNLYIGGNLNLTDGASFYYPIGEPFGIAYFDQNDQLVSTGTTAVAISETNYIVSTDSLGIPTWANVIDGGLY